MATNGQEKTEPTMILFRAQAFGEEFRLKEADMTCLFKDDSFAEIGCLVHGSNGTPLGRARIGWLYKDDGFRLRVDAEQKATTINATFSIYNSSLNINFPKPIFPRNLTVTT